MSASVNADEFDDDATFTGPPGGENEYVADEILVILADPASTSEAEATAGDIEAMVGGTVRQRISFLTPRRNKRTPRQTQPDNRQLLRVKLPRGKSVKQAIAEQQNQKDPRIVLVEPNYKVRILAIPNDPLFEYMWALRNAGQTGGTAYADIDAVSAWDVTTGSDNVVVAVIDTGIDYLHPDLAENMWTNTAEIPGNGIDDDGNGYIDDIHGYDFCANDGDAMDEHSHGTHCAGTIAARGNNGVGVTGVNWRCKLMACRFLDEGGSGSVADAIDAINYAVANGADILSNSWGGGGYSAALAAAITNARDNGVLFVAAAGNNARNTDVVPSYPASYTIENVIAVAATNHNDALASFSNYGRRSVHLAAPGVSILSSVLDQEYAQYSGTSMATPHVAGVAALLLAHDPTMTAYELKSRLIWTGDPLESQSSKTITGRRLNAYNALTAQPALTVRAPNGQVTWTQGFDWPIQWVSIGGGETVDIYLLKADIAVEQLADDVPNTGTFYWSITDGVAVGSDYKVWIDDGVNTDESDADFAISDTPADYFTELFSVSAGRFDLSNKSLLLTPDDSASRYTACLKEITELPVNPLGSTNLELRDDDAEEVTLTGHSVQFYGASYSSFYVGSNGYITFDEADSSYNESRPQHFALKRIAGLFRDLDPSTAGSVRAKQLDDRVVIIWNAVPEYGGTKANTFQVEMFYDGPIRLSWLSVAARSGIVGISEGLGTPVDLQQSDISGYEECEPQLESVEVTGPDSIAEQSAAQFVCIARYDDGSTQDVTQDTSWSEDSDYTAVNSSGRLTAGDVSTYQQCTVTANYNDKSDNHTLIVTDSAIHTITIQKCTVRPGKTTGLDSIKCSGSFGATADLFAAAENVTVRIYSAGDDYLVYEQTIDLDSFRQSRTTYRYKHRVRSGEPGGISSLRFDVRKNKFYLQAKNIDLTGLGCPLHVLIDIGSYVGLGIAEEDVVNGRKTIPVRLLNGYADTLAVTKAKVRMRNSEDPLIDRFSVNGTFTVADDSTVADGLTITWDSSTFTIPGDQFSSVGKSRLRSKYLAGDGAILYADFNSSRGLFKIVIKRTAITPESETADFGVTFGNYDKTDDIQI